MSRIYIILSFVLYLFSCSEIVTQSANSREADKIRFSDLCRRLPDVRLPFEVSCENCCVQPQLAGEQLQISNYLPEGVSFSGIIEINSRFVSILGTYSADSVIPVVITFDLSGTVTDEKVFLERSCGNDSASIEKQYFYIRNSRELLEVDTLYFVKYDSEYNVTDTIRTEIEDKQFVITSEGKIKPL